MYDECIHRPREQKAAEIEAVTKNGHVVVPTAEESSSLLHGNDRQSLSSRADIEDFTQVQMFYRFVKKRKMRDQMINIVNFALCSTVCQF